MSDVFYNLAWGAWRGSCHLQIVVAVIGAIL